MRSIASSAWEWRIPKLERFGKPVVIWQNGNEGIDFGSITAVPSE